MKKMSILMISMKNTDKNTKKISAILTCKKKSKDKSNKWILWRKTCKKKKNMVRMMKILLIIPMIQKVFSMLNTNVQE